jgi:PmbA protein
MMGAALQALHDSAGQALALMQRQGFDHVQVDAWSTTMDELNIAHNEPSLMRSTEQRRLALLGIVDGRKASTELTDVAPEALAQRIAALHADALAAPRDDANAVSQGQRARLVQGPQQGDGAQLADKVAELLAFRAAETPKAMLEEGLASHTLAERCCLTSGGTELLASVGSYALAVVASARDGGRVSSFNFTGGNADRLDDRHASEHFGIGEMLRACERQIHTAPVGAKFVGDVVLTPSAVQDLIGWLLEQLGDTRLIDGSSLYLERVGQRIASPLLTLDSRFDAPGVGALSGDGFVAPPVRIVDAGRLGRLTPSLYASRKTGIAHVPLAWGGWALAAGDSTRDALVEAVSRGALVDRLSMGNPAPNGDFSGVIKNSFVIDGGRLGGALSETMISGNIAQMLRDVAGVSRERIDTGSWLLPWLRITGLHFS